MERDPMPKLIDITGQRFGRLVVLRQDGLKGRHIGWLCACDCGASHRATAWDMKRGRTTSCGCQREDNAAARKANKFSNIPEYRTWLAMRSRCGNPKSIAWPQYGGRGIAVCERWQESFIAFVADMGPRPFGMTIDRIDPNKGYFKENCRWATDKTQARNKTNSVMVDFHGVRQSLWGLCEAYGVSPKHCSRKLKSGLTVEQILGLAPPRLARPGFALGSTGARKTTRRFSATTQHKARRSRPPSAAAGCL